MSAYYNEYDRNAAAWLRQLIKDGLIAPGEVDERSIEDVLPADLMGFKQCHFFAGIGGWSYALRLTGWPDDRPVWTASCPCQPFSQAGKGKGIVDERHLWPATKWLIDQLRPSTIFGEQVASKAGRDWFCGVRIDLEAMGYASGAADLCAAGIGAPHIRQRLYWVAHSDRYRCNKKRTDKSKKWSNGTLRNNINNSRLGNPHCQGSQKRVGIHRTQSETKPANKGQAFKLPMHPGWGEHWIPCGDGKKRRIESGLAPVADGIPYRTPIIRGYGNAIVPQVAAEFIKAFT